MKIPQMNPPETGNPSEYYEAFEIIPHHPEQAGSPLTKIGGQVHFASIPGNGISATFQQSAGNSNL